MRGLFLSLAIVSRAAMNIAVQMLHPHTDFIPFEIVHSSSILESCARSFLSFVFILYLFVFYFVVLLVFVFLVLFILAEVRYLIMVLICTSLTISEVEPFFNVHIGHLYILF
jgi:hypothetical protein